MQFIVLVMESTLIFPLKYFPFLSHQVHKAIKTGKTAQRSFKKIKVPKVFRRRREFSVIIFFSFTKTARLQQDNYRTSEPCEPFSVYQISDTSYLEKKKKILQTTEISLECLNVTLLSKWRLQILFLRNCGSLYCSSVRSAKSFKSKYI